MNDNSFKTISATNSVQINGAKATPLWVFEFNDKFMSDLHTNR